MKKTIATITCNNVYNHGATLQQYALLAYLENIKHNAYTIDYRPPYLSNHFKFGLVGNPRYSKNIFVKAIYLTLKFPGRLMALKRKNRFDNFEEKYLNKSSTIYYSNEDLKNNLPKADVYICGSDQIWNSFFQNGRDPVFYLDFVPDDKLKISYAASFAIDEIDENLKPFVKDKVSRINKVSVRESSGLRILEQLDIKNSVQVLDPVFLLPAELWQKTFVKEMKEDFIFIYDCDSNEEIKKTAIRIAKENKYKIFTVDKNIKYADRNFYYEDPAVFLSLIYNAKLILANSFHALSFSLIFNKKFLIFNRFEKINTRMRDLMVSLEVEDQLVEVFDKGINDIEVDYSVVNSKLDIFREKSKKFLKNALDIKYKGGI